MHMFFFQQKRIVKHLTRINSLSFRRNESMKLYLCIHNPSGLAMRRILKNLEISTKRFARIKSHLIYITFSLVQFKQKMLINK